MKRRTFIENSSKAAAGLSVLGLASCSGSSSSKKEEQTKIIEAAAPAALFFDISLAQWCFNKAIFSGEMDHLDFAVRAKKEFDISAVEYVNQFFPDKATDKAYLNEMKLRADDNGVTSVLIMVDNEGDLAYTDKAKLDESIEKHYKWVEAAQHLGCHAIRVNSRGDGSFDDAKAAAVDGLGRLTTFAKDYGISVIVEPHGNFSSHGGWLADVMKQVNMPGCGTLPDFGNFCYERNENRECTGQYDIYQATEELMPYAKGVSAKTFVFDENGNEANYDYVKLMTIIKDSGFKGYIGVEYEGHDISPEEGVTLTRDLIKRVGAQIS